MSENDVVIVAAARTPQGRLKGQLAAFTAPQLDRSRSARPGAGGVDPADVDAVIVGQVLAAGSGQNAARQAAIGAGIGWDVPRALREQGVPVRAHRGDRRGAHDPDAGTPRWSSPPAWSP
ncbi:hypothetical protein AB1285_26375 [Microbacterium sp. NRRL B-14842]|uniref:thiolase family protein n=1 Tax=Microbacterium sp. NRRL B-14842 TaxID=3162881 RepID=UPI003D27D371